MISFAPRFSEVLREPDQFEWPFQRLKVLMEIHTLTYLMIGDPCPKDDIANGTTVAY